MGERGQGTISDFGTLAVWDAAIHARDFGGLRLLVPSLGGKDGAMIGGPVVTTVNPGGSGTRPERALEAINTFPRAQRESRSLSELPCERRSGPAEPSPGMPKRPEPPPEQELPVPRHSIAKKPLFGPGTAAQSMVCGPGCAVRGAWSEERGRSVG